MLGQGLLQQHTATQRESGVTKYSDYNVVHTTIIVNMMTSKIVQTEQHGVKEQGVKECMKWWHSRLSSATRAEFEAILRQILSNNAEVGEGPCTRSEFAQALLSHVIDSTDICKHNSAHTRKCMVFCALNFASNPSP